jgi:hypothetical protein
MLLTAGGILYVTDSRRNIMLLTAGGILYVTDNSMNIICYWWPF